MTTKSFAGVDADMESRVVDRLNSLGLSIEMFWLNDSLYGQCSPREHADYLLRESDTEILAWAKSFES
jgi:hypothetical protein